MPSTSAYAAGPGDWRDDEESNDGGTVVLCAHRVRSSTTHSVIRTTRSRTFRPGQFPGSWLPFGQEQVIRCTRPHFRLVSSVSGRLDYIETIRQWDKRTEAWNPRMALLKLRLLPKWLTSRDFRFAYTSGVSSNSACFERELIDHYRLVFEKL